MLRYLQIQWLKLGVKFCVVKYWATALPVAITCAFRVRFLTRTHKSFFGALKANIQFIKYTWENVGKQLEKRAKLEKCWR